MNLFKKLKIKKLRNKKDKLFELSFKYGSIDRKKSDEYYSQAILIGDKIKKLLEE